MSDPTDHTPEYDGWRLRIRNEFVMQDVDGDWYFATRGPGTWSAHHLRVVVEVLDELNQPIRPEQTTEEVQQEAAERAVAEVAGMPEAERQMHFMAGRAYGREATCGTKIDYTSQASAERAATRMTAKGGKTLEAYPCWWCEGWHIGRAMTAEERERFQRD